MTIELLPILEAFSGGIIISSLFFITHIFSSINPYHKPLFPLASCISMIIFVALIVSSTSDDSVITSVRIVTSDAALGIIALLPLSLAILTYFLIGQTFPKGRSGHEPQ